MSSARANFLDEGRRLVKGISIDNTRWNRVVIGDSVYTVERAAQLQAKINLDEIHFTPASEKSLHKDQCALCKLHFEKTSVSKLVPNHRLLALQRNWNMPLEGKRYNCGSYLYASTKVCTLCAQFFQDVVEPLPSSDTMRSTRSGRGKGGKGKGVGYEWTNSHSDTFSVTSIDAPSSSFSGGGGGGRHGTAVGDGDGTATFGEHAFSTAGSLYEGSVGSLGPGSPLSPAGKLRIRAIAPGSPSSPGSPSVCSGKQLLRGATVGTATAITSQVLVDLEKLTIQTVIQRSDIAPGHRVYQSSTVDAMAADNAISAPYAKHTRTRREVDPWWELDFSRRYHIDNLSLEVLTGHAQRIFISVVLLSKPTGFEDPFLDSVIPRCVAWKEFMLPENAAPKWETVSWALPASSICAAIRVQIRGIHTLSIRKFQAFLGDSFVEESDKDWNQTAESYATMAPADLKAARDAMVSPEQKRFRARIAKMEAEKYSLKRRNRSEIEDRLFELTKQASIRENEVEGWRRHVQSYLLGFDEEFVLHVFRHVFIPAVTEGVKNGNGKNNLPPHRKLLEFEEREREAPIRRVRNYPETTTEPDPFAEGLAEEGSFFLTGGLEEASGLQSHNDTSPRSNLSGSLAAAITASSGSGIAAGHEAPPKPKVKEKVVEKIYFGISESDLEHDALVLHYPRCELSDMLYRVRGLLIQISSRNNLKAIGCLAQSEELNKMADESAEVLRDLQRECRALQESFEAKVRASRDDKGLLRPGKTDPAEDRGLSWGQFIVLFRLLVLRQWRPMVAAVYGNAWEENVNGGGGRGGGGEVQASPSLSGGPSGMLSITLSTRSATTSKKRGKAAKATPEKARPVTAADSPLLFNARNPLIPPLDTRFSEYKLSNFSKRAAGEMPFPPTLTLDFTQKMLEFEKAKKSGGVELRPVHVEEEDDGLPHPHGSTSPGGGWPALRTPGSAPSPSSSNMFGSSLPATIDNNRAATASAASSGSSEERHDTGAPRSCALCVVTFPRDATNIQVLFKHVITLRRRWDPSLVPKDIEALEQGTSMFNLVHVCGFCHQYFDPDFDGGIAFPSRNKKQAKQKTVLPAADVSTSDAHFDERFPLPETNLFVDKHFLEARGRAKRTLELISKEEDGDDGK